MPPSTTRVITAFKLIMETLVLARPLHKAKSSGRESRWARLLKRYKEELVRMETGIRAMRWYWDFEKEEAFRINRIQSMRNYGNGSEEQIEAVIDLPVDLDVQSR